MKEVKIKNWKEKWGGYDAIQYLLRESSKRSQGFGIAAMAIDACICLVKYGATFHDYINLRFYIRDKTERSKFLTTQMVKKEKRKWPEEMIEKIDNKKSFNKLFPEDIGREWLDINDIDFSIFYDFTKQHNSFYIKPKRESCGIGIMYCQCNEVNDLRTFFTSLQAKDVLIEEELNMCGKMKEMSPNSMSHIRVVTVVGSRDVHILAATLRIGYNSKFNTAANDIFAQINIKSGEVFTPGIDENGILYEVHPDSGMDIYGYKIPDWDNVIKLCERCARKVSEVRVIGWDVVITDKGCYLLEGNPGSGVASMQIADGVGKKELFYKYLM